MTVCASASLVVAQVRNEGRSILGLGPEGTLLREVVFSEPQFRACIGYRSDLDCVGMRGTLDKEPASQS